VDVTKKKKRKRKEKKKEKDSENGCVVCILFMNVFYLFIFYDKIAKIKEEFNILIGSRSRILNLYVSCISNIR
jgi:hypothetical protein